MKCLLPFATEFKISTFHRICLTKEMLSEWVVTTNSRCVVLRELGCEWNGIGAIHDEKCKFFVIWSSQNLILCIDYSIELRINNRLWTWRDRTFDFIEWKRILNVNSPSPLPNDISFGIHTHDEITVPSAIRALNSWRRKFYFHLGHPIHFSLVERHGRRPLCVEWKKDEIEWNQMVFPSLIELVIKAAAKRTE